MKKGINTKKKFKFNKENMFRIMCIFLAFLMVLPLIATAVGMIM